VIAAVQVIARKDFVERIRDKSFFLLGILTPLVLAFILDLVFGDIGEGQLEGRAGIVDADGSDVSQQLYDGVVAIDGEGGLTLIALDAGSDPGTAVDDRDLDAVIVIPDGFGTAVSSPGADAPRLQIVADPDRPIQAGLVESVADGFVAGIERTRLLAGAGAQLDVDVDLSAPAADLEVIQEPPGEGLDTGARMMAGMAIMFVFFTVQFGVTTLLSEKET
jgi:ABC-2 type transport system permease protein